MTLTVKRGIFNKVELVQAIGDILHRKCTLGTSLGVRAFEPSLFEPRVACLVKMNAVFSGTGKSV